MNILFVVPYVPNLIRIRSYNLIRALTSHGHTLTVATLWSDHEECHAIDDLKKECYRVIAFHQSKIRSLINSVAAVPTMVPIQSVYSWHPRLSKFLNELSQSMNEAEKFDIVHIEHLRGVRYGLNLKLKLDSQQFGQSSITPVVWDSVDCISLLFKQAAKYSESYRSRLISRFELGRTERYERYLVDQFDRVLVTSINDKTALLALNSPPSKIDLISVLPNGVDLTYYSPGEELSREPDSVIISGKMSYHANVSMTINFIENILPIIWTQRPNVNLWIVGKDPPAKIKKYSQNPLIKVTGTVKDIRPFLQRATVAVAPLTYGVGIQNKILESMACATPVVTTTKAVSPLDATAGLELIAVDEPMDFAQAVLKLLDDNQYRNQIGYAGRKFVEKNHNWDTITTKLELIYQKVIDKNSH